MHMITGLHMTERVTLTILKMRNEGLCGSDPVDMSLFLDVFASKLHTILQLLTVQGTFPAVSKKCVDNTIRRGSFGFGTSNDTIRQS